MMEMSEFRSPNAKPLKPESDAGNDRFGIRSILHQFAQHYPRPTVQWNGNWTGNRVKREAKYGSGGQCEGGRKEYFLEKN